MTLYWGVRACCREGAPRDGPGHAGQNDVTSLLSASAFYGVHIIRYILTYVVISRTTCKVSLEALPTLCKPFPLKKGIMFKK